MVWEQRLKRYHDGRKKDSSILQQIEAQEHSQGIVQCSASCKHSKLDCSQGDILGSLAEEDIFGKVS